MKNINPKISIIIPAYNAGPYIAETLECILRQSMNDYEIIIVNDGSTDNTQKIVDDYSRLYPGIINSFYEENSGQSKARNLALEHATGEYVAFVDADDLISDDYLEKLYNTIRYKDADIAKCSMIDFDSITGEQKMVCSASERTIEYEDGYFYIFHYSPCAGLVRKKFLSDNSIRFSVGEQMEDSPYSLLVNTLANDMAIIDESLYFHRINHEISTITRVNKAKEDPKIPYRGIESAIQKIVSILTDKAKLEFFEYSVIRTLANFTTVQYKNYGKEIRRQLCNYCYRIIDEYFPNLMKNPFVFGEKQRNIRNIPFKFRSAVKMFAVSYKLHMLYQYSWLCSRFL